jgi:tetratricopeptide (TPR) repeat protein
LKFLHRIQNIRGLGKVKMSHGLTLGKVLGFLLAVVCLAGCSHPVKTNRSLAELDEEIRRNTALVTLDSNNVAAHRALGNAYMEQAKIQQRLSRSRKQAWPYSTRFHKPDPPGVERAIFHLTAATKRDSLNDMLWAELAKAHLFRYSISGTAYHGPDSKMKRRTIELVQKALNLNPQLPQANYLMGVLSADYRHPDKALAFFQRAIDAKPDFADALFAMGDVYSRSGDFSAVEDIQEQQTSYVLAHSFKRRAVSAGLSDPEAYLDIGDSDPNWRLMLYYRASISNVPFVARGLFDLGMQIFLSSYEDWNYKWCSRAFELDSVSSATVSRYSNACLEKGDTVRAIKYYMKADVRSWWYNGRLYKRVVQEHPDFVSAYVDFAEAVSYRARDTSILLLKKAISLDPARGDAHLFLFREYLEKGTPDSSITYLETYLGSSKPDTAYDVYRDLGWLYLQKQNLKSFKNLFEKAGIAKPFVLDAHMLFDWQDYKRGPVLVSIRRAYESLLGTDPRSNAMVYTTLANIASYANDSTAELFYREQAYGSDPKTEWAGPSLAGMCMDRHLYGRALKLLNVLLKSNPEDVDLLYSAALSLDQLGRKKEASVYYRRVTEVEPDAANDSYWSAKRLPNSPYQVKMYQRAARLGHKAAQDTLKSRNITW